jgi:RHS repeat-associated protein
MRTLYDGQGFEVIREGEVFGDGAFTTKFSTGRISGVTGGGAADGGRYRWIGESAEEGRYRYINEETGMAAQGRYTGVQVTLYGKGEAVGMNLSGSTGGRGGTVYLGKDILGSVRTTSNEYGSLEERYEYDAFGKPYKGDLGGGMNLGYTGKPYDPATGLYDYGYRDYKPELARFTTADPIRDGANWFAYVNNDPVNYVDLWGLEVTAVLLDNGKISIVDSNNNQVGVLTATSFRPTATKYRIGGFSVGAEIEMVYNDSGSGYTDFNFVQTVESTEKNQPLERSVDAPEESSPFYNTPQDTAMYGMSNGAYFSDSPSRPNPVASINWEAETSLFQKF